VLPAIMLSTNGSSIKPEESSTEGTAGVACSGLFCMADMFGSIQVDGRVKALCRRQ
jgi:hypothetical protein